MPRVKRGTIASKRRKNILKDAKGYRWRRKNTIKAAKEAVIKAGKYAYRDRRNKKRTFRALWILKLSNALGQFDMKYSRFIKLMKDKNIELDRKVLSQMAVQNPETFAKFVEQIKA